jgi:phenylpyruvate tautomerase PptA (4-oxalocrotonate tautomerase family)
MVFVHITLNQGRSLELKQHLYRAVADGLHSRLGVRQEDVFIGLIEVPKENWSFGDGEAPVRFLNSPLSCHRAVSVKCTTVHALRAFTMPIDLLTHRSEPFRCHLG